jgi:hypothetical protein
MNTQTATTPASKLTSHQVRTYGPEPIAEYGRGAKITATVRYDDSCSNGHNTFSITASIHVPGEGEVAGGCMHAEIARYFPELAPLVQWHLVSTDGPLHYVENTMFWLGRRGYTNGKLGDPPNLEHACHAACWPKMPAGYVITGTLLSNATIKAALARRLPALLARFRATVESLGMVY